jgi:hypothetical protein
LSGNPYLRGGQAYSSVGIHHLCHTISDILDVSVNILNGLSFLFQKWMRIDAKAVHSVFNLLRLN